MHSRGHSMRNGALHTTHCHWSSVCKPTLAVRPRPAVARRSSAAADAASTAPAVDGAAGGEAAPAADAAASGGREQGREQQQAPWEPPPISQHVLERNAELRAKLEGQLILAPLTRGCHVPFRRLCADFGAEVTFGEMAFARGLIKGDRVERARLVKAPNEACFGVQIATNQISEGVAAAKLAKEAGASFVDLNCGCPIREATRRGLGAVLLRKPTKLARLVAGIVAGSDLPVTVKIRTGENDSKINAAAVAELMERAGAAAVTIHGRTMEQRYKKAADWSLISEVAAARSIPVIGNGDILTLYEARDRAARRGAAALMVGRGALIKPWVFQEYKEGREISLDARERVGVYRQLVAHMKEHFRDDARGKKSAFYFLPWHFAWFHRYRAFPSETYSEASRQHPLIATRIDLADPLVGETEEGLPLLERLLRSDHEAAHLAIADAIWDATSDADAAAALERLAAAELGGWEAEARAGRGRASGGSSSAEAERG
ncbi:MAG: dihydrouridine synthase-domain-containing protein [Monoraphidium minutum]|nr:MAG: dihydrouridine synthase-domain-containing protein [Monoraphidium minutum]